MFSFIFPMSSSLRFEFAVFFLYIILRLLTGFAVFDNLFFPRIRFAPKLTFFFAKVRFSLDFKY